MNESTEDTTLRERRRSGLVRRLLAEEPVDSAELAELDYQIHNQWHLGVIVMGAGTDEILGPNGYNGELLSVLLDVKMWIWHSAQQRASLEDIVWPSTDSHLSLLLAIGEPGRGMAGWRLTHHQAQAALEIALHKPERFARYADYRLLAAVLQNDTLAKSLNQRYLMPLGNQRDGGAKLRQTLRAYIDAGCIASSAASPLRVGRHTVEDRVRTVESLIGCPLRACMAELDVALRMAELNSAFAIDGP